MSNTQSLRLIFVARKFANVAGGMERICIDLMNAMVNRGHQVALVTWDDSSAVPHYQLDYRIKWIKLNIGNPEITSSTRNRWMRIQKFRKFLKIFKPNVILGFQSGAALFSNVASLGMGIKIVAAERVSPDMWKYVRTKLFHRILDIYLLALADRITVQFSDYISKYPLFFQKKIIAIHNPVFPKKNKNLVPSNKHQKILLYVARFCFQKNHELLINAFATLDQFFTNWRLVLAGDGEYLDRVKNRVMQLNLQNQVIFCGAVKDVDALYQQADLVAFPSYFEGFPNALSEALAWGIPCVGLKETLGVNSLIHNGVNGLLVNGSVNEFANGLAALMSNDELRKKMSEEARKITTKYSPDESYELWEALLEDLTGCK